MKNRDENSKSPSSKTSPKGMIISCGPPKEYVDSKKSELLP